MFNIGMITMCDFICSKLHFHFSCPPVEVIKDLLSSVERVTFYGFLIGLAKHTGVNESIGKVFLFLKQFLVDYH